MGCNSGRLDRGDHPVNCVRWSEARAYCEWTGARLCSEAEWEYAARSGGRDIAYPWGDEPATCGRAIMREAQKGCGFDRTWPTCSKPAGSSEQGACDLAGNVWEWVEDDYHAGYRGAPTDSRPWVDAPNRGAERTVRGGSFDFGAAFLRAADRFRYNPNVRFPILGVRCCRSSL